jgi:anti-sigma factor RsiW
VTCTEFLAMLDDMIDGSVATETRTEIEEHLRGCEHCVVTLNTTRKTIEIYRSNTLYELPNSLRERLHKAILAKCRKGC